MQPILTPLQMAEADQRTIAAGTAVEVLMQRAGRAVAWEVRQRLGEAYGKRVVVVAGKGNNGGDALIAADTLRGWGVRVDVFELTDGVPEAPFRRALRRADLLIDGMFGTGFRGALEGDAALVARHSRDLPTVAVDIPSGVDGLTGAIDGEAVQAIATVTFAARKTGLVFEPGRSHAGDVITADIGIDVTAGGHALGLIDESDVRAWLPSAQGESHKWRSGLLVVGGSGGMTGAPLMVSHAAMRAGAGIVWCAMPDRDAAVGASGTEVITKEMPATADGALSGVADVVQDALDRFAAIAIGPGLGTNTKTTKVVRELVLAAPSPLVLDADGLNAFAGHAESLRERAAPTVLTPHAAEYERLFGEPAADDRISAARALADVTDCVVLLKGPGTVIAESSRTSQGRVAVNGRDGPWLGTAGTGDVLTGIIGGLLARGMDAWQAAAAGAYVHGLAADEAGHVGLVAGALVDALPRALTRLSD